MLIEPLMARLSELPRAFRYVLRHLSPHLVQAVANGELDVAVCFNAGEDRRVDAKSILKKIFAWLARQSFWPHRKRNQFGRGTCLPSFLDETIFCAG